MSRDRGLVGIPGIQKAGRGASALADPELVTLGLGHPQNHKSVTRAPDFTIPLKAQTSQ